MQVQVVSYSLNGVSEQQYITDATQAAAQVASTPGLLATVWTEDPENGRYGAIYLWEDEEAVERGRIWVHSGADDIMVESYNVLERLTKATQPVLSLL